ncbi:MAG TPA: DUF2939 domain-containing protein [Allosphingosinicella sp.]|jgi:hypothetical protein
MRKGRTIALAAALFLLLAAGWWFGSPWWTLWRIREAAEAQDSEAVAAYIDLPALRASTREQLASHLGPLGSALAGPAVDTLVSPTGIEVALGIGGAGEREGGPGEVDLARTGSGEFRVRREGGDLIFRRHGLGWKLEEIRLSSKGLKREPG